MISDRFLRSVTGAPGAVAVAGDLVRLATWIAGVLAVVGSVSYFLPTSMRVLAGTHFNDFGRFYYATVGSLAGRDMYAPSPATAIALPGAAPVQLLDLNPPLFHALMVPFASLRIDLAFVLWAILSLECLAASGVLILRELRPTPTASGVAWTMVAIAASAPTMASVVTGQLTFVLMLPLTLAWRAGRHGRWKTAAIFLGVLASLKLFIAAFALLFVATRRWNALAWMAAATVGGFVLGVLAFGIPAHAAWIHALASVSWPWLPMNASFAGLLSRAFDGGPVYIPLVFESGAVRMGAAAGAVVLTLVTGIAVARDHGRGTVDRAFLAIGLLAVLISPLGWVYYLWLLAGPAVATWLAERDDPSRLRDWLMLLAIPGLFAPIALTLMWAKEPWNGVSLGSTYTWSTLLLWAAVIVDSGVRRRHDAASASDGLRGR